MLKAGNERRRCEFTQANAVSSRSHAVLQIVVESREKAEGVEARVKIGKLSLVDLAGSERASVTKNRGTRLQEGANINRSLLALGNCINALSEKNRGQFIPYRDSKLTRLLKDSLGGNCRTVMIANVSPSVKSFEETLNTVKYANRAKNIKTKIKRNVLEMDHHISEYVQLISNLRSEINLLRFQFINYCNDDFIVNFDRKQLDEQPEEKEKEKKKEMEEEEEKTDEELRIFVPPQSPSPVPPPSSASSSFSASLKRPLSRAISNLVGRVSGTTTPNPNMVELEVLKEMREKVFKCSFIIILMCVFNIRS